jgi:predicted small secreted protein
MLLATFIAATALTGCNTMRGAGEDVEDAGEAVEDAID